MAISAVSGAVAVAGLYTSYEGAQDAKKAAQASASEQRAQAQAQQRIADIKNQRERAQVAREANIARGRIENAAGVGNTTFSSGAQGGLASVGSQEASNIGVFDAIAQNNTAITTSQINQSFDIEAGASAQARVATGQALYTIGSDIFKASGGAKNIFDNFNGNSRMPGSSVSSPTASSPSGGYFRGLKM